MRTREMEKMAVGEKCGNCGKKIETKKDLGGMFVGKSLGHGGFPEYVCVECAGKVRDGRLDWSSTGGFQQL